MKKKILITMGLAIFAALGASQKTFDFPSQRFSKPEHFLLASRGDMRLFLCGLPALTNRISKGLCLVDCISSKTSSDTKLVKEIRVGAGMPLSDVLVIAGFDNTGKQVRVFSQNMIQQSPILKKWEDPEAVKFRNSVIMPGDLVILTITREW